MWCRDCQQDVRAIMLPTERGDAPHCPRCGALLRISVPSPEPFREMAEAAGDPPLARRGLPVSLVSTATTAGVESPPSMTIRAPRRARRADISIDWQWDEERRALRRIHASLEGGAMYRFDRAHLPEATPVAALTETSTGARQERVSQERGAQERAPQRNVSTAAGGLLFIGLATLSAGAAFFAHSLWSGAASGMGIPLVIAGQTMITFALIFQMDLLRRDQSPVTR